MAVSLAPNYISYVVDGFTTAFSFPYYLYNEGDLIVQGYNNFTGDLITYVAGTDWNPAPSPDYPDEFGSWPLGLFVVFNTAPTFGILLIIQRQTVKTQNTVFVDNSPFTAETLNKALDKLTLITQDISTRFKGFAYTPPQGGAITYQLGDYFLQLNPGIGGYFGYICTASGAPGTWAGFGLIVALP